MGSERNNILGRIREGLRMPAPVPGHGHRDPVGHPEGSVPSTPRDWLPRVGPSFEERLALFQKKAAELKVEFRLLNHPNELRAALLALRDTENWKRVGVHAGNLTEPSCQALGLPVCRTDQPYPVSQLENCDAGITECDALVAQTGSVLVTSRSAGGRALSVLPPHHVVLARRDQLVGDLPEAFALLQSRYAPDYPSFISFITGPSRTGDIERILVLGAHGPKKLTIFCL